jgi:hypothetical protein
MTGTLFVKRAGRGPGPRQSRVMPRFDHEEESVLRPPRRAGLGRGEHNDSDISSLCRSRRLMPWPSQHVPIAQNAAGRGRCG